MKVKYYPNQPHCFAFGGFDMQMLNALRAVRGNNIDAEKLDIWSRDQDFDILHLWGIGPHNFNVINWAKKSNKNLVATVLLPYFNTLREKLSYCKHYLTHQQKKLLHFYSLIDKIVVVNEMQADVLSGFYKVSREKINIIPNIVEDQYFKTPDFNFVEKYKIANYILCTGNISPRKNQLNLMRACINLKISLVLIGKCLDGEREYGKSLELTMKDCSNILWIKELERGSMELVSSYFFCRAFALPSNDETQPISALEATAMNKPLILQDRGYAKQKYYSNSILCKNGTPSEIEKALSLLLKDTNHRKYNECILDCTERNVGLKYIEVYNEICNFRK